MKSSNSLSMRLGLAAQIAALSLYGCQKKDSKGDTASDESKEEAPDAGTPGVTATSGNEVILTGVLNLGALELTQSTKGILAFNIAAGKVTGKREVEVDADGKFSVTVAKADEVVDSLLAEMDKTPETRDWQAMYDGASQITDLRGMTVEDLKSMSEEDLAEGITDLANDLKNAGSMTLLVAYDKSGDPVAEAASFRFIGMPTATGKALSGLSNADLKGNVSFGKISGEGSDITSEVEAADAFDLSAAALESLADSSRALKMVKNKHMNDKWSVDPFYFWKSNVAKADVVDKFSDINLNTYHGYGFYVPSEGDQGLTYEDLCGDKTIKLTPPEALTEKDWSGTVRAVAEYSNAGSTKSTQGDSKICQGNGFYGRQDNRSEGLSYMLNFGTGGSIQSSPEGLWKMTIDGTEVGRYDLALTSPMVDGKPAVLLPQAKFTTSGGNITGVEVQLFRWNGTAYEQVTDMAPVKKLFSEFSASITRTSDNGEARTRLTVNEDGTITGAFDSSESDEGSESGGPLNAPVATSDVTSFAVYYNIGQASYRMEFR